jgi:Fur family peroxide stress response transcriptional regulator
MLKYSKQREAIKMYLLNHPNHPTAETIYSDLREEFPNLSLGTVYRNLSLLAQTGEIQKITTGIGADRFEANQMPHYHFICNYCGAVYDILPKQLHFQNELILHDFDGDVEEHNIYFYGRCPMCKEH